MNFDDFGEWMRTAQTTFPKMKSWLKTQPEQGRGLWKTWRKVMNDVSLEMALAALDRMVADSSKQVFGDRWDTLPGIVISLCVSGGAKPKGDRKCICGGDGIVQVGMLFPCDTFDGNPLRGFSREGEDLWGPIGAACLCPVGSWINDCRQKKVDSAMGPRLLPVYKPQHMRLLNGQDDIFAAQLAEKERQSLSQVLMQFEGTQPTDELSGDFR